MQWKRIGLLTAAGALLLMGGCDAAATEMSSAPSSAAASEATAVPTAEETETVSTESAEAVSTDEAAPGLPSADQTEMTVSVLGKIAGLDPQEHFVTISEGGDLTDMSTAVQALVTDDTLIIDCVTGRTVAEADLSVGQTVSAAVSPRMTRSVPPQAEAYALIVNLPETGLGVANYIRAMDVLMTENGSTIVLNQNADLYVTIPAELEVEKLDSEQTVPASDIKVGSVLIAWYDSVAESYPAQATASRVVLAG